MESTVTPEMIAELPKWAQEHIKHLDSERFVAVRALNQALDKQTPSKIYYDDHVCTGETHSPSCKRRYVQSDHLIFKSSGVMLQVSCHDNTHNMHDPGIELSWMDAQEGGSMVAAIPNGFQSLALIARHNMRARTPLSDSECQHYMVPTKHCLKCGWNYQL